MLALEDGTVMMLEIVGAALLVAGSALVLWIVFTADATSRPSRLRPAHGHEAEPPIVLKRAA
jgi:hypothetical protein